MADGKLFPRKHKLFRASGMRGVVNYDDDFGHRSGTRGPCPMHTFSTAATKRIITARDITMSAGAAVFSFVGNAMIGGWDFGHAGVFSVSNADGGPLLAFWRLGSPGCVLEGASSCPGITGRDEVQPTTRLHVISRDFAHTPVGLENDLCPAQLCYGATSWLFDARLPGSTSAPRCSLQWREGSTCFPHLG
jgi:UDP-N-acetylmuramyl tripeptide synthase